MGEHTLSRADQGKRVVDATGQEVGRIAEVEGDHAYVDPAPSVADTVMSKLGWGSRDGTYRLPPDGVDAVTDDEVRLAPLQNS